MQLKFQNPTLEKALFEICQLVQQASGRAYLNGGSVRDFLLGQPAEDLDIEVYQLEQDALQQLLSKKFKLQHVGKHFGVLKVCGLPIDLSLPREETKIAPGHKGFSTTTKPNLDLKKACSRRDFTINAMLYDPLQNQILDFYNGQKDLEQKVLRHTSDKFIEDPLRVLRAMQFAARFNLQVAPETIALCKKIEPEGLPAERMFEEWKKLLIRGQKISIGLEFLKNCGWTQYYPELQALMGCPQEPKWHPEGNVWEHTLLCLDAFASVRKQEPQEDLLVGLAVLCHDFGKPLTTQKHKDGHIRSIGHDMAGLAPTQSFLHRLTNQQKLIKEVGDLVLHHMQPYQLYQSNAGLKAIRRLSCKVRLDRLARVNHADQNGRGEPVQPTSKVSQWLLEQAAAALVQNTAPQPLVLGRHLIKLGLKPSQKFSEILQQCYEAQLDGQFASIEEAQPFLQKLLQQTKNAE